MKLITTPQYLLWVDEKDTVDVSNLRNGEYYVEHTQVNPDGYELWVKHFDDSIENSFRLVAHRPLTDAPLLEGVLLMPESNGEDIVEQLALKAFPDPTYVPHNHLTEIMKQNEIKRAENDRKKWIAGYKTASQGKWTDEQVEDIIDKWIIYKRETACKGMNLREFIQSLSKQPIGFVPSDKYATFAENIAHGKYIYDKGDMETHT